VAAVEIPEDAVCGFESGLEGWLGGQQNRQAEAQIQKSAEDQKRSA
jgi:hypothetical protein